ncbi:hypothetical protein [Arenicella xantha]|uniref:Uncharacterized protein n=1 Tax=Arenicella xantha TaxID=644221 RepID=A0A395JJD5_9GAMM|nr:hypothetical protein [Arenicella xantha]RBP50619.1 hypothetical protein DFR28_10230 [Arenicella xantha]
MKNIKASEHSDIFSESMIVDYVGGHIEDDTVRADFEKKLANNARLKRAVDEERQLRDALHSLEHASAEHEVTSSEDGLEKLFAKLDEVEDDAAIQQHQDSKTGFRVVSRNWFAGAGIAASLAFVAMLLVGTEVTTTTSDFTLLSDPQSATQADFNDLVKARRVAQVWLVNELPAAELTRLFGQYQLTLISRAGAAWIVASSTPLSDQQLTQLEAVASFKQVSLISYNN